MKRLVLFLIIFLISTFASASDGPQLAFTRYLIAIQSATSLDDISPLLSANRLRTLSEDPEKALTRIKTEQNTMNVAKMTLLQQKTTGDRAELHFDLGDVANGVNGRRMVILIRENGEWRIDQIN